MTWQAGKEEVSAFKLVPLFTFIPTCVISNRISGNITTVPASCSLRFQWVQGQVKQQTPFEGGGGGGGKQFFHTNKKLHSVSLYRVVLVDVI